MSKSEIAIHILDKAVEIIKYVIPALITWHFKQPFYMKKKSDCDKCLNK